MDVIEADPFVALRKRIARGEAAQGLLADPALASVLDELEKMAVDTWRISAGPGGLDAREGAHAMIAGVDALRGRLRSLVQDGEIARDQLEEASEDNEPA